MTRLIHYFIHENSVKMRNKGILLPPLIWNIILNWKWNSFLKKPYMPQKHDFLMPRHLIPSPLSNCDFLDKWGFFQMPSTPMK